MLSDKVTVVREKISKIEVACKYARNDKLVFEDDGQQDAVISIIDGGCKSQIAVHISAVRDMIEALTSWADAVEQEQDGVI